MTNILVRFSDGRLHTDTSAECYFHKFYVETESRLKDLQGAMSLRLDGVRRRWRRESVLWIYHEGDDKDDDFNFIEISHMLDYVIKSVKNSPWYSSINIHSQKCSA